MKKKLWIIVVAVVLVAAIVAGVLLALPGKKAPEDKATKIVWWVYGSEAPIDTQLVVDAANKYSAEKIGVTVDLLFLDEEGFNREMDADTYFDMTFTCDWANDFASNAYNENFKDITELVKTKTPALYAAIDQKYWDVAGSLNGKIYAVPTLKDMASQQFFRMDKERYEALGFTLPEYIEFRDLEPMLKAYKETYNEYPMAMGKGGLTGMTNSAQWIAGSYLCSPYHLAGTERENQIIPFWEDEVLMERYQLLHKWYELGYINPDAATVESQGKEVRTIRSGSAWPGYYAGHTSWGDMEVQGVCYAGPFMSTATMRGAMNAISANATEEKAIACLKYLELLNTDRTFRDILRFGIEGTHFNYVDVDGVKAVKRTEQGTNNWSMDGFVTGSVVNASVTSDAIYDWEEIFKGYEKALVSTLGTFSFNKENVEAECAACSAVMAKYNSELYTGTLDIDEMLPQIKAELEKAGIYTIQAEAQRQLDEYLGK